MLIIVAGKLSRAKLARSRRILYVCVQFAWHHHAAVRALTPTSWPLPAAFAHICAVYLMGQDPERCSRPIHTDHPLQASKQGARGEPCPPCPSHVLW